ncbi:MAG: SGNH/GDSL hydrolase family protein [Alphaproteobacteria bacterium]|nr:SGNH/GDSL hydrolase family protein [Alphaproteobacteria bacterium]
MLVLTLPMSASAAEPEPVVAVGDGIVVPTAAPGDVASGGFVAVLADCLEERSPARFRVVDRAVAGETLETFRGKLGEVRELGPSWVIVTLGARELAVAEADPKAVGSELGAVVAELRKGKGPSVVLVGPVPPTLAEEEAQATADARVKAFNEVVASVAGGARGVFHVDPLVEWTRAEHPRAGLVSETGSLSDQGQAKVAASVCDVVMSPR